VKFRLFFTHSLENETIVNDERRSLRKKKNHSFITYNLHDIVFVLKKSDIVVVYQ